MRPTAGVLNDPRILAGGAAGFACAAACLWAFRGLPLGTLLLWASSLPLFLAGLSLGQFSAALGAALAALALLLVVGFHGAVVFLLVAALPAVTILAAALRRPDRLELSLPLALLGIWPAITGVASLLVTGEVLEQAIVDQIKPVLQEAAITADDATVAALVRMGIAFASAALALPLMLCGIGAQAWLSRRRLALRPAPDWSSARLPSWYPVLPVAALAAAWMAPGLMASVVATALLTPLFLQGLAAVHRRARGPVLVLFYLVLVLFSVPAAALVVGLGLFEQFGRKPPQS
ncbi:Hypothetical protein HVPorG_04418 [Roseomonas mucosa]|uniref:DUF2232 domain-containing protein n=1 Tax=Roseomonas mucosa TaxID=207340 RepID=A0A1S8D6B3_9PROT|nr:MULTISPECIES: hypothetical protein [Roseomonas]MBS5902877.1 hypothetical protein [Acetobacteraceae bacterium]AWV24436.1 Hypothetical protein RADP37_04418 [Roseomonas mucosa]MCG7352912.1 hypothetical protein [Roseomonas mucosa]MCG7356776.1 hypothetical protein [Roseomonas mucosa]MDT8274838.1 hypothetical protein [Roseomonas mucosa]